MGCYNIINNINYDTLWYNEKYTIIYNILKFLNLLSTTIKVKN